MCIRDRDYVRTLLRYLAQAASIDRLTGDELRQAVTQTLSGGGELMLTIAEQWEQQAMEKGIEKGMETVSYTHLDVYKRQTIGFPFFCPLFSLFS